MIDPLTVIHSDALSALRDVDGESVQTCVTSPPYWRLRDYGTGKWVGGDPECEHTSMRKSPESDARNKQGTNAGSSRDPIRSDCRHCGAERVDVQIGLEKTPEEYVSKLVEVFSEMRRVLRSDGTLWLNLGDSYMANRGNTPEKPGYDNKAAGNGANLFYPGKKDIPGYKTKDLVGIPWMVAFALRSDGWYLRSDIIWSKPNPMPESVTDRPTKSHEYIFLLSKSERYYYDATVIQEEAKEGMDLGLLRGNGCGTDPGVAWHAPSIRARQAAGVDSRSAGTGWRNKRSVWSVPTAPYIGAHFATFPPDLIKPCILAGAPAGGVVLDPFAGSGTTGKVAIELGRKAVLIEPKAEYIEMIKRRCQTTIGLPI
jgi:DNA modification methylase